MNEQHMAPFGARLGAFALDLVLICGLQVLGGIAIAAIVSPLTDRPGDPVDWLSPQAAGAMVFTAFGLPLLYLAASWSRLMGHRSIGKRLFRLRVIRDDR